MSTHLQIEAFNSVYTQNPCSPVLAFYAGLTKLEISEVRDTILKVLKNPFDILDTVDDSSAFEGLHRTSPTQSPRHQLLSLINCICEVQSLDFFYSRGTLWVY